MKVRSMRGEMLDMGTYLAQNQTQVALGNARMNARGDIIGPGGKVIRPRADIAAEYHKQSKTAAKHVPISQLESEIFQTPAEALKALEATRPAAQTKRKIVDEE